MRTKAALVVGGAIGYVLGTRAGQERWEKIRTSAQKVWENPKVQERVSGVQEKATGLVKDKAPQLQEKLPFGRSSGSAAASVDAPDELGTFTTAGSDETELNAYGAPNGAPGTTGTSGTYPTGGSQL